MKKLKLIFILAFVSLVSFSQELHWALDEFNTFPGASLITGNSSTFDSGVGDWVDERLGSIAAVGGEGHITTGANTVSGAKILSLFDVGELYAVSFRYKLVSGNANSWQLREPNDANLVAFTPSAEWQTLSVKVVAATTPIVLAQITLEAGNVVAFDNITARQLDQFSRESQSSELGAVFDLHNVLDGSASGLRWFELDGVDDYIPGIASTITQYPFSMGVRFNADNVTDAAYSLSINNAGSAIKFISIGHISGNIRIYRRDGVGEFFTETSQAISVNNWYSVLVVFNSTTSIDVYLNGAKEAKTVSSIDISDFDNITIGSLREASPSQYFDGDISQILVYNYALSQAQVDSLSQIEYPIDEVDKGADNSILNVSSTVNGSYTTFGGASATGFAVTSDGVGTQTCGTADEIPIINGKDYLITFDLTLNSGTLPNCKLRESFAGALISNSVVASSGANSFILTATGSATGVLRFDNASTTTDYSVSNLNIVELGNTLNLNSSGIWSNAWYDYDHDVFANGTGVTARINSESNMGASHFNGVTTLVNLDSIVPYLVDDDQGTWSVWINPADSAPSSSQRIIGFGDTDGQTRLLMELFTDGKIKVFCENASVNEWGLETDNSIGSGWTNIMLVQDVSPIIYINGIAVDQTFNLSTDKTVWYSQMSATMDNGRIGCLNFNSAGDDTFYSGLVRGFKIWHTALSSDEVTEEYDRTKK